jgi:hypothetical protein
VFLRLYGAFGVQASDKQYIVYTGCQQYIVYTRSL